MRRPTILQINAVVLAVGLTGSYVWFRAVQAQQLKDRVMSSSKLGRVRLVHPGAATTTASTPPVLLPGSKSFVLTAPATEIGSTNATQPAIPSPTTSKVLFYGSKSGAVDLSPALQIIVDAEQPVILTNPPVTAVPATQPAR